MKTVLQNKRIVPRPFWIPASNYFALTFGFAVAVFFIVLGVLHEDSEDFSFVFAGICFFAVVITAVLVRGKLLVRFQLHLLVNQEKFNAKPSSLKTDNANKLTIEKNNSILKEIERKSKAADVLGTLSEAHWEVFKLCSSYLEVAEKELTNAGTGSPRIASLRKGSEKTRKMHKHHLLVWAANESKNYTQESKVRTDPDKKIEAGNKALYVLESALYYYPEENNLLDSAAAVKEFIISTKVSNWIEEAEKAKFNGENQRAIILYRDILFLLARENVKTAEKDLIADKINLEIDKLRDSTEKCPNLM